MAALPDTWRSHGRPSLADRARAVKGAISPDTLGLEKLREKRPGEWMARCPAHDDNSPSLSIRRKGDGLAFKCFACGFSGTELDVIAALNGIGSLRGQDFAQVVELAEKIAGTNSSPSVTSGTKTADPPWRDKDAATLERFIDMLVVWTDRDERDRHLSRWGLRGEDAGEDVLLMPRDEYDHTNRPLQFSFFCAVCDEVSVEALNRSGIASEEPPRFLYTEHLLTTVWRTPDGQPYNLRRRILRELNQGEKTPRYVVLSNGHIGQRPSWPFGVHRLKEKPDTPVAIAEGALDALAVEAIARDQGNEILGLGLPSASDWKPEWARLLKGREVLVATDDDDAGRSAANRIRNDLERIGVEWERATPVGEGDWADALVRMRGGKR